VKRSYFFFNTIISLFLSSNPKFPYCAHKKQPDFNLISIFAMNAILFCCFRSQIFELRCILELLINHLRLAILFPSRLFVQGVPFAVLVSLIQYLDSLPLGCKIITCFPFILKTRCSRTVITPRLPLMSYLENECCCYRSKCLWAQFTLPEQNRPQCSYDSLHLIFTERRVRGVEILDPY
jgi:hypothetical protein